MEPGPVCCANRLHILLEIVAREKLTEKLLPFELPLQMSRGIVEVMVKGNTFKALTDKSCSTTIVMMMKVIKKWKGMSSVWVVDSSEIK